MSRYAIIQRRTVVDFAAAITGGAVLATALSGVPATWTVPMVVLTFLAALVIGNAHDVQGEDRYR